MARGRAVVSGGRHALAALLLLTCGVAAAAAAPVPLGSCGPVNRLYSTVELPAGRLDRVGNPPLDHLGVLALRDGTLVPIPFQIDERRGRKIALPEGPEPTDDDKPGVLDADDLVVFMACDVGSQATPPALAAYPAWRELRIEDPLDHTIGFAYLVVADHPPASDRRYVDYDAATDIVSTARYRVGLVHALPVYMGLSLDGPLGPNVLDGLRLRAEATLLAGLVHWTLNEQQARNELIAWKTGPVRVVRRSRHHVKIGLGIELSAGVAHSYFAAQHVIAPGMLKLPFSPSIFFRDITAFAGADFRDLAGWRFHAPGVPPEGFLIDGKPDDAERAYKHDGGWFAVTHGHEALVVATTLSENLARAVPLGVTYVDDAARRAPPENAPGSVPLAGFRGRNLEDLEGGRYTFELRVYAMARYRPGDESRVLAQTATDLAADVSARSAPAGAPVAPR